MPGSKITIPQGCAQAIGIALTMLASTPSAAIANPPIRMTHGIEYMAGGGSDAERSFMGAVAPRWAGALRFAVCDNAGGELPGAIDVRVVDRYSARPVMQFSTSSPIVVVRFDPGAYEIEATMGGVTLRQSLTVFAGLHSSASFTWPTNVDYAARPQGR